MSRFTQLFQDGGKPMRYVYYPELVWGYPERFKLDLHYNPCSDERSPTATQSDLHFRVPIREPSSYSIQLPSVFALLVAVQFQVWLTRGYGKYVVENERAKNGKQKICLNTCPSYIYYLNPEELRPMQQWCELVNRDLERMALFNKK
jgi:NAD-dependent dihydropyrimidine dehydrogenase PreA subunit